MSRQRRVLDSNGRADSTFRSFALLLLSSSELLVCCSFLYSILSWSAFAGVAASKFTSRRITCGGSLRRERKAQRTDSISPFLSVQFTVILLMPLQVYLTSLGYTLQHKYRKASDTRTNLLSELINSIKVDPLSSSHATNRS